MKTEVKKDQRDIIQSIKLQNGYAKKWASGWQVGNPDLICSLPDIGSFLMEVKTLIVTTTNFQLVLNQKLDVSKKQRHELKSWNEAKMRAVLGVVVRGPLQQKQLFIMPWWTEFLGDDGVCVPWAFKKYDVVSLMWRFIGGHIRGQN